MSQPIVKGLRNVDCGSDWHDIIMAQVTDLIDPMQAIRTD
jgi:hypothetical protein